MNTQNRGSFSVESTFVIFIVTNIIILFLVIIMDINSSNILIKEKFFENIYNKYSNGKEDFGGSLIKFNTLEYSFGNIVVDFKQYNWDNVNMHGYFVTDSGGKYHIYGCPYLESSCHMEFGEALQGYEPCKICILGGNYGF